VAGNALAIPGLGCPNEAVEIIVIGEGDEVTTHAASIVPGVAGTSPHKLKLFTETAAGTGRSSR